MPLWPQSPDVFFALGDLLLDWAIRNPEQAAQEILPVVEQAWLKCLEIGEQPSLEGSVRGRGSFLAAHHLAVLSEQLGRLDEAEDDRSRASVRWVVGSNLRSIRRSSISASASDQPPAAKIATAFRGTSVICLIFSGLRTRENPEQQHTISP
jgi:hypothetical protein